MRNERSSTVDDGYRYKFIVTTTINSPTEATKKFAKIALRDNWRFVVVGDTGTPHEEYEALEGCEYLHPDKQQELFPTLSALLGWKTIQRRNIGLIYAHNEGADVVATVDDDNIPYDNWGRNLLIGKTVEVDYYKTDNEAFDPLSVTNHSHLWHRGYPVQLLKNRLNVEYAGKVMRKVLVQADLWDGDPDIDAMARLTYSPCVKFDTAQPFCGNKISPFNSQNTFLSREVLSFYSVLPFVGRMDDIWGSYLMQTYFSNNVVYNKASVYQDRNAQDLITNLQAEIIGYRNTISLITDIGLYYNSLPSGTKDFLNQYPTCFAR